MPAEAATAAISVPLAESRVLTAGTRQGHVASALGSPLHTRLLLPLLHQLIPKPTVIFSR